MTLDDARAAALALEGVEERSHFNRPDFRVGGRVFMTLHEDKGCVMLVLPVELQSALVEADPDVYLTELLGGWAKYGSTLVSVGALAAAEFGEVLEAAWEHRARRARKRG